MEDIELQRIKLRESIFRMKNLFKENIEFIVLGVHYAKTYYQALIDEGFTATEALQIVCSHGVSPKFYSGN